MLPPHEFSKVALQGSGLIGAVDGAVEEEGTLVIVAEPFPFLVEAVPLGALGRLFFLSTLVLLLLLLSFAIVEDE
jgi:hypothetical protein